MKKERVELVKVKPVPRGWTCADNRQAASSSAWEAAAAAGL